MSTVYFASARLAGGRGLMERLEALVGAAGLEFVQPGDLVGVKLSFGEYGNTAFLRPPYVRKVVDLIRARGGKPFLTDSNTLYHGRRANSVDHVSLAIEHGFGYAQIGAPVILADGLRSGIVAEIPVGHRHFDTVKVGAVAMEMDALVCLSHFKGHLVAGFGGAIKNIGMGLASRATKQRMHAGTVRPSFAKGQTCTACGRCVEVCQVGAARLEGDRAVFDYDLCVGCADCIPACPAGVLELLWTEKPEVLGEKMAEVTEAIVRRLSGRCLYVNFLLDITPDCDCFPRNDVPIVPDIGILASRDPVALDLASAELVNAQASEPGSVIGGHPAGADKFRALHPEIDWRAQLRHAESIGLGSCTYTLRELS